LDLGFGDRSVGDVTVVACRSNGSKEVVKSVNKISGCSPTITQACLSFELLLDRSHGARFTTETLLRLVHPIERKSSMTTKPQPKELTPEGVEHYYNALRNWTEAKREPSAEVPKRWNANEFQALSGYAIRVAKSTTLDQFNHFLHTGETPTPIKMTPAELEVLQGGSKTTDWLGAAAAWGAGAVVAAGAAACI
jgi:hypothetical protein